MASNAEISGNLTSYQYVRLGQVIACSHMESIALGYLDIDEEKIKNLKAARRDDTEGFVRDLIKEWAYRNPNNQIQVRTYFYDNEPKLAARDGRDILSKIQVLISK